MALIVREEPSKTDWQMRYDETYGANYWVNTRTGASTWEDPFREEGEAAGWTFNVDEQGRGFWVNEESGESVWDQDHAEEVGANRNPSSAETQVLETWLHEARSRLS